MVSKSNYRKLAHDALRPLWLEGTSLIESRGVEVTPGFREVPRIEPDDIRIWRIGDAFYFEGEFERSISRTLIQETVTLQTPEDPSDLSRSIIEVDWYNRNDGRSGVITLPIVKFPEVAYELAELMRMSTNVMS